MAVRNSSLIKNEMPTGYQFDAADDTLYVVHLPQYGEMNLRKVTTGSGAQKKEAYVSVTPKGEVAALVRYTSDKTTGSFKKNEDNKITQQSDPLILKPEDIDAYGWTLAWKTKKAHKNTARTPRVTAAAEPNCRQSPVLPVLMLTHPDDLQLGSADSLQTFAADLADNISRLESESSQIAQAILNNPDALVLYRSMKSTLPFVETMGAVMLVLNEAKLKLDQNTINKNQLSLYLKDIQTAALEKVRNSWLFKLMSSPLSGLILGLVCLAIAIIACLPGAGFIVAAVLTAILITVVTVGVSLATNSLRNDLDELKDALKEAFGDAAASIVRAFEKLSNELIAVAAGIIVAVTIMLLLSLYMGHAAGASAASGGGGTGHLIKLGLKNLGKKLIANGGAKTKAMLGGISSIINVFSQVVEGLLMKFSAEFDRTQGHLAGEVAQFRARSNFLSDIVEKIQGTMGKLLQYVQELIKNQSNFIKVLGDNSSIITRNFAI